MYEWFRAIEDNSVVFGTETEIKRDKSRLRNVKEHKRVFTHLEIFKFHISQIIGKDNLGLVKVNKTTGRKVKTVVSSEKSAVLVYNVRKGHVTLRVNYELYNRYDVLCADFSFYVFSVFLVKNAKIEVLILEQELNQKIH